jgi:hypothetical protein
VQLRADIDADKPRFESRAYHSFHDDCEFFSFITEDGSPRMSSDEPEVTPRNSSLSIQAKPGGVFLQKALAPIRDSFLQATKAVPAEGTRFKGTKPLCSCHLKNATMQSVRSAVEQDHHWFMSRFQVEVLKAHDMSITPWTQEEGMQGTSVRRSKYKVPRPDDLPKALANMIGFPAIINSVTLARLHCTDDRITLVLQSAATNVPYGDRQRVEDVLVFTAHPSGGVSVSKWMTGFRMAALPWAIRMSGPLFDSKVKADAKKTFDPLVSIMEKDLSV